jgi:hypothetical protein
LAAPAETTPPEETDGMASRKNLTFGNLPVLIEVLNSQEVIGVRTRPTTETPAKA